MADGTDLSKKMRSRADADGLPADHHLRTLADAFDASTKGFYAQPQTVTTGIFMRDWTRARRAWCDYSGESLL